eukprot:1093958-Rhodomonas_salina.3
MHPSMRSAEPEIATTPPCSAELQASKELSTRVSDDASWYKTPPLPRAWIPRKVEPLTCAVTSCIACTSPPIPCVVQLDADTPSMCSLTPDLACTTACWPSKSRIAVSDSRTRLLPDAASAAPR